MTGANYMTGGITSRLIFSDQVKKKLSINCEYFIPIITFNICFRCSKEPSSEYPQHIFWLIFFICESCLFLQVGGDRKCTA